jgi:hypothetical protein
MMAGLFSEKVGIMENPLVVSDRLPLKKVTGLVVSICWLYPGKDNARKMPIVSACFL